MESTPQYTKEVIREKVPSIEVKTPDFYAGMDEAFNLMHTFISQSKYVMLPKGKKGRNIRYISQEAVLNRINSYMNIKS